MDNLTRNDVVDDGVVVDISDSKILDLMSCFGHILQSQMIPNQRSKESHASALGASSILQYYKIIKAVLKSRFCTAVPADETWYTELLESLNKHLQ